MIFSAEAVLPANAALATIVAKINLTIENSNLENFDNATSNIRDDVCTKQEIKVIRLAALGFQLVGDLIFF